MGEMAILGLHHAAPIAVPLGSDLSVAFTPAADGARSAPEYPQQETEDDAEQQRRRQGDVKAKAAATDHKISRQPPKSDPLNERPQEPDGDEQEAEVDEEA